MAEVRGKKGGEWFYTKTVKDHFFRPRNALTPEDKKRIKFNGTGVEGSPACGDVMEMHILVDPKTEKIKKCKWSTFGCASAIASTSMLSVMVTEKRGMNLEDARKLTPKDILKRLGGLPERKIHCSVLGDKALRTAINDYYKQKGEMEKVIEAGVKVVDKILKITDKDIEEAVLEGARSMGDLQKKTKIGIQDKNCIPEAERLLKYYAEKHFGKQE